VGKGIEPFGLRPTPCAHTLHVSVFVSMVPYAHAILALLQFAPYRRHALAHALAALVEWLMLFRTFGIVARPYLVWRLRGRVQRLFEIWPTSRTLSR
jgi:hypothetical protein